MIEGDVWVFEPRYYTREEGGPPNVNLARTLKATDEIRGDACQVVAYFFVEDEEGEA